jgi:hypothetical protein
MSVFQILGYRRGSDRGTVEIEVQCRSGEVSAGDAFVCYDTQHSVLYRVRSVRADAPDTRLICEGEFCYDDAFVKAVIDTAAKGRPDGFHYE